MAAIKLLLGMFCLTFIGSITELKRYLLIEKTNHQLNTDDVHRAQLVHIAENEIGVREKIGRNDGVKVELYLKSAKLHKGQPWCAAFISWIYEQQGYVKPRTGWSPDLFPSSKLVKIALPGNILGIYFPELKRIAHVGLIVKSDGNWCTSIEGNTNITGSREGDGVYRKRRHFKTIYRIADWVTKGQRL